MRTTPGGAERERLEQLVLAGAALSSEATLQGVLTKVVAIAAEVVGARYAAIGVVAADRDDLEQFVTHGFTDAERAAIGAPPGRHGLLGALVRDGRPIRLDDLASHPDASGVPPQHPAMHSFLGVPVVGRHGPIGNLYLTEKLGAAGFTPEDEHVAMLLAAITAAAVENARLHEESAQLLAEVHQLHRTRERFFAMVNHEMRNALAAVYGWAELLVRKQDPAKVPLPAYEVLESAERAVELISDLLDLSRLDEDRLKLAIRPVRVDELVRRAVKRAVPGHLPRGLRLELQLEASLPRLDTDASRVEQILVNLLTNAIKYTAEGTVIRLTAMADDGKILFRVEDEGDGIRPEDAERIFDIYVTSADGEKQGVGLGLPLSRRLALLLGGTLWAVPQRGAGIFILALPIRRGS